MIIQDGTNYYTLTETAERLCISPQALRAYLNYKRIECTKVKNHSYFTDAQIEKFIRPRKDKLVKPKKDWREELENMVDRVYRKYSKGVRA